MMQMQTLTTVRVLVKDVCHNGLIITMHWLRKIPYLQTSVIREGCMSEWADNFDSLATKIL